MPKTLRSRHNEIFLSLLRSRRQSMGLRQTDLAVLIGQDQGTVSKVERGERRLDVIELRAWLGALEVDFVSFVNELDGLLQPHPLVDARLSSPKRSIDQRGAVRRRSNSS
jgi:transcriptional regulator with XRE-family HTH domain